MNRFYSTNKVRAFSGRAQSLRAAALVDEVVGLDLEDEVVAVDVVAGRGEVPLQDARARHRGGELWHGDEVVEVARVGTREAPAEAGDGCVAKSVHGQGCLSVPERVTAE